MYIYIYIYLYIYIYVQCKCRRVCSLVLQRALHMYITHTAAHQAADSSALALAWHRGHRVDKSFTSSSRTIPKTTQVSQQGQGRKLKVAIANLRRSPHVHIIVCLVMTSWHSGEKPEMLISCPEKSNSLCCLRLRRGHYQLDCSSPGSWAQHSLGPYRPD